MKKVILSVFIMLIGFSSFAEESKQKEGKKENIPSYCHTSTSSVTDENGVVLFSATCTRCSESAPVAVVSSALCAAGAVKRMMADY